MRELDSRAAPFAPALAHRGGSFGRQFKAVDALGGVLDAAPRLKLVPLPRIRPSLRAGRAHLRTGPNDDDGDSGTGSPFGVRDDDDDDDDDSGSDGDSDDDGKTGKKKHAKGKGSGKGKKKGKDDDDDDDYKPKKHPIQPPAPHGPPPSFPHPFPHPPPHLPPPHGPPPKGPHPPFHPTGGTHPKVALSSSAADDTLTTPIAKPTQSSAGPAEPSSPPESVSESSPPHESQTYAGGTFTQPVTATTPLPKQGSQPHETGGNIEPTASPSANAKKGFPLAAAGIIGGVLSFLLVSGIVWGIWFWMRRRRRARAPPAHWDFPPRALRPQSDGITVSTRTISTTVPQFASAAEAGAPSRAAANANPFAHRDDGRERDPFASAPPTLRLGTIDAPLSRMFI